MEIKELIQKIGLPKLVVIVLAGVMLLVLSLPQTNSSSDGESTDKTEAVSTDDMLSAMEEYVKRQEDETEKILSKAEGIGEVKVMLTLASSEEKITLQDDSVTEDESTQEDTSGGTRKDSNSQSKEESVLVKQDGDELPYVVQVRSPVIEGVVVVAQGVNTSREKAEIIEAIQALFPIEAHKIKVMKME